MAFFTVWPDGKRPSDYPEIQALGEEEAAQEFAKQKYHGDTPFEEISLWVQERGNDTPFLMHVKAEPDIYFNVTSED